MTPEQHQIKGITNAGFSTAALLLLCVITLVTAYSLVQSGRGSDQFWYLSDTATIAESNTNHSNLTMPGVALRQNNGTPSTPFYHNGPLLYLNAVAARVTGLDSFTIWKFNNFLFSLAAALLTALLVAGAAGRKFGIYAFSIYVLSPLNVWLTVNSLQETFYAFLLATQLFIILKHRQSALALLILLISLVAGAYSHPFFKLIALSIGVVYLIDRKFTPSFFIFASIVFVSVSQEQLFPTSFPPDLKSLIAYSVPGKSNSLWHQSDFTLLVTPELLYQKLVRAITIQFTDLKVPVLSLVTYLSIPAFFVLLLRKDQLASKGQTLNLLLWLSAIAFALYAGIVVLMQFQVRYQQIIAPASVALLVLALFTVAKQHADKLIILLALGFVAIDIKLITTAQADGIAFKQSSDKFSEFIERFPSDARVAFVNDKELGAYLHLVRSAKPRQTMVIGTNWLSDESYAKALDLFQPDLLIYSESERALATNSGNLIEISDFHKVGKLYYQASQN